MRAFYLLIKKLLTSMYLYKKDFSEVFKKLTKSELFYRLRRFFWCTMMTILVYLMIKTDIFRVAQSVQGIPTDVLDIQRAYLLMFFFCFFKLASNSRSEAEERLKWSHPETLKENPETLKEILIEVYEHFWLLILLLTILTILSTYVGYYANIHTFQFAPAIFWAILFDIFFVITFFFTILMVYKYHVYIVLFLVGVLFFLLFIIYIIFFR